MLVVAKISKGHEDYYLANVSLADDAEEGLSERPGRWAGAGAVRLGLAGRTVEADALASVLSGHHPGDDSQLHGAVRRVKVAAFDLTFSVPKSVSLLHALGPSEVGGIVAGAHERAVEASIGYLERQACAVRRSSGGRRAAEEGAGLVAGCFLHRTSRASEPHLHTHGLVANLAEDARGRWSALDARPLYLHAVSAGALYEAQLRDELTRHLGVAWRVRESGGSEVAGLADNVLAAFSTRSRQIADALEESGRTGPRAARIASLRTRPAKDVSVAYPRLVERWRETAYDLGIADLRWSRIASERRSRKDGHLPGIDPTREARRAVEGALDRFERPFSRIDLLAESARRAPSGFVLAEGEAVADGLLDGTGSVTRRGTSRRSLAVRNGPMPSGRSEPLYGTERLARIEASLEGELAARRSVLGDEPFPVGTVVLSTTRERVLEIHEELGRRGGLAEGVGRQLRAHGPHPRAASTFESLTGIVTSSGPRPPIPSPGSVVLVAAADEMGLSALEQLMVLARSRRASLVLVVGPAPFARQAPSAARELLTSASVPVRVDPWSRGELSRELAEDASQVGGTRYSLGLKGAVGVAIGELSRARLAGDRSVLVAPDRISASAIDRLVSENVHKAVDGLAPVVSAGELDGLRGNRPTKLVVLGVGRPLLGKESGREPTVVQVAVVPRGHLARGAAGPELGRSMARGATASHDPGRGRDRGHGLGLSG